MTKKFVWSDDFVIKRTKVDVFWSKNVENSVFFMKKSEIKEIERRFKVSSNKKFGLLCKRALWLIFTNTYLIFPNLVKKKFILIEQFQTFAYFCLSSVIVELFSYL